LITEVISYVQAKFELDITENIENIMKKPSVSLDLAEKRPISDFSNSIYSTETKVFGVNLYIKRKWVSRSLI